MVACMVPILQVHHCVMISYIPQLSYRPSFSFSEEQWRKVCHGRSVCVWLLWACKGQITRKCLIITWSWCWYVMMLLSLLLFLKLISFFGNRLVFFLLFNKIMNRAHFICVHSKVELLWLERLFDWWSRHECDLRILEQHHAAVPRHREPRQRVCQFHESKLST